ncbi:uncharacterized protein [Palaemon carinicauda]|uniref:uncharacterized protein n=1 Tax=Palaemon carinicauda TaxID=392227 RepID=UPI0035B59498
MQENNCKEWSVGLKSVQWQINISRHETTGHSPFKVTFGQEPQVGLGSSLLPRSALNEIVTEEGLETFVENKEGDEDAVTEVTAQVENVDRGPSDPKNLLVVVMKGEDGLYTVGCREGFFGSKYTAADLSLIDQVLIKADDVPDIRLTLRTATAKATGGQGTHKFHKSASRPPERIPARGPLGGKWIFRLLREAPKVGLSDEPKTLDSFGDFIIHFDSDI